MLQISLRKLRAHTREALGPKAQRAWAEVGGGRVGSQQCQNRP